MAPSRILWLKIRRTPASRDSTVGRSLFAVAARCGCSMNIAADAATRLNVTVL